METLEINETLKTIYERRAVRKFKDRPVEQVLIERIIEAGKMAPSAINRQPWKFFILKDKVSIEKFSKETGKAAAKGILKAGVKGIVKSALSSFHLVDSIHFLKGNDPIFHGAPVVIFISAPKDDEWAGLDIGMCAQNMMLAARSLGMDTCPVGLGKFVEETKLYPTLHVPESDHILIALILGYGDEIPEVHERVKHRINYLPAD
jgi:nitroreductase